MANEIELNDEQLAAVTGGSFNLDLTKISAAAHNSFSQSTAIDGSTTVGVLGGGKKSTTEVAVQGATIANVGNTAIGLNNISL
jgi:bacteriocin-like protein